VEGQQHVRAPFRLHRTPPRPFCAAPGLDESGPSIRGWLTGLANGEHQLMSDRLRNRVDTEGASP
jgi:hypothetical protein